MPGRGASSQTEPHARPHQFQRAGCSGALQGFEIGHAHLRFMDRRISVEEAKVNLSMSSRGAATHGVHGDAAGNALRQAKPARA
jgi:hypothetical protein